MRKLPKKTKEKMIKSLNGNYNQTENIESDFQYVYGNVFNFNYGCISIQWVEKEKNKFEGVIEVNGLEYILSAIFNRDEGNFLVYVPGIIELNNGHITNSLQNFPIVEWCVQSIQENQQENQQDTIC